jgi:anthranilate synthase component 2
VVTAYTADATIMGLSHRRFPLHGVQFHPESFLTEHGFSLVENFLRLGPLKSGLAEERPGAATPFQPAQTRSRKTDQARVS